MATPVTNQVGGLAQLLAEKLYLCLVASPSSAGLSTELATSALLTVLHFYSVSDQ